MSDKRKEVVVYFTNNNKAKFPLDRIVWSENVLDPGEVFREQDGKIYVNSQAVAFIREFEQLPSVDDDD